MRELRQVKDESGKVTGWSVTVREYGYRPDDDDTAPGAVAWVKQAESAFVDWPDRSGSRYSISPRWQSMTYFGFDGNVSQQIAFKPDGTPLRTIFSDHVNGRPRLVIDPYGNETRSAYDEDGNLLWSVESCGGTRSGRLCSRGNHRGFNPASLRRTDLRGLVGGLVAAAGLASSPFSQ